MLNVFKYLLVFKNNKYLQCLTKKADFQVENLSMISVLL